jgi:hypothetical protein
MSDRHTFCTYEHPAARHDIEAWREAMEAKGRIMDWVEQSNGMTKVIIASSDGQAVESMLIVPVDSRVRDHEARATYWATTDRWDKWLHFGRLTFSPGDYCRIWEMVKRG